MCVSLLHAGAMASSSDDDDDDEKEDETEEPTPKASPFEAKAEKSKSRSRRRRRRHTERRGRERDEGASRSRRRRESRAESRDGGHRDGRNSHHGGGHGRTLSSVPEPPDPPRRNEDARLRSRVPEPSAPPSRKNTEVKGKPGPKGGKGNFKGAKRWKCPLCKTRVAAHKAALEQHQWLNEWCIAHQNWEKLTHSQQGEPGAWAKCREKAFYTKCGRTSEAVEAGMDLPSDDDRSEPSPLARPMSSAGSVRLRAKETPTVAEPSDVKVARPVDDQGKKKKKKKAKKDSSPDSSGSKKKKKKPHKGSESSGSSRPRAAKRKQVVINFH